MKNQNSFTATGVDHHAPNNFNLRRELLESTKLSRIPLLPRQQTAQPEKPVVLCVRCETELKEDNPKINGARVCVDCLSIYATIGTELERAADRKSRPAGVGMFAEGKR